ncbi:protoporphyrinogen oxidase protein [Rutstroemia sp. NJR-2017a BVV2]|nr:protoporphyrinogen oxidase protein [Rutstroemia sp. NJR-2017a BVV2]
MSMRPRLSESALVLLLRQCYRTPRCQNAQLPRIRSHLKAFSSTTRVQSSHGERTSSKKVEKEGSKRGSVSLRQNRANGAAKHDAQWLSKPDANIAVLGSGITGLATAYYLTQFAPDLKVTLYEGSDRLGGWMQSKQIDLKDGQVVFEQGPRTLRPLSPAGLVTLNLIRDLDLHSQVLTTSKNSDAARNRFVYYPDHLVRMPGPGQNLYSTLWSILTEPVFKGIWNAGFEYSSPPRPSNLDDESIGSFLNRRCGGQDLGNNLVSAVLHGIYAGDIYKLSMRSLLPLPWKLELEAGSIVKALLASPKPGTVTSVDRALADEEAGRMSAEEKAAWKITSVYTFRGGIRTLSEALESSLRSNPNVTIKLNHQLKGVAFDKEHDAIKIRTSNGKASHYKAISTLSGPTLYKLAPNHSMLPSLGQIESVTVMVVNLYYRDENLLPERGFGYLIPRSIPFEQNPEFALGVVFDTYATLGQDTIPGTKLTVMLGGHWWSDFDSYPDEDEGAAMAKAVLKRHLKIDQEPEAVHVTLQKDCIPQYTVGHHSRMEKAHQELRNAYKGKLAVAGNSYTGVGVNDCIRAAKDVAREIANHRDVTGLEKFSQPVQWVQNFRL